MPNLSMYNCNTAFSSPARTPSAMARSQRIASVASFCFSSSVAATRSITAGNLFARITSIATAIDFRSPRTILARSLSSASSITPSAAMTVMADSTRADFGVSVAVFPVNLSKIPMLFTFLIPTILIMEVNGVYGKYFNG